MNYFIGYLIIGFFNYLWSLKRLKRVLADPEHEDHEKTKEAMKEKDKSPTIVFLIVMLVYPLGWLMRFVKLINKWGEK